MAAALAEAESARPASAASAAASAAARGLPRERVLRPWACRHRAGCGAVDVHHRPHHSPSAASGRRTHPPCAGLWQHLSQMAAGWWLDEAAVCWLRGASYAYDDSPKPRLAPGVCMVNGTWVLGDDASIGERPAVPIPDEGKRSDPDGKRDADGIWLPVPGCWSSGRDGWCGVNIDIVLGSRLVKLAHAPRRVLESLGGGPPPSRPSVSYYLELYFLPNLLRRRSMSPYFWVLWQGCSLQKRRRRRSRRGQEQGQEHRAQQQPTQVQSNSSKEWEGEKERHCQEAANVRQAAPWRQLNRMCCSPMQSSVGDARANDANGRSKYEI